MDVVATYQSVKRLECMYGMMTWNDQHTVPNVKNKGSKLMNYDHYGSFGIK